MSVQWDCIFNGDCHAGKTESDVLDEDVGAGGGFGGGGGGDWTGIIARFLSY